jgi:carboxymethylenebutenolidase
MSEASEDRCRSILRGAIEFVGANARVCTIGWCFGGGWSLQATLALQAKAAGCIIYYGMPENDKTKIATLQAPVLFILAKKDGWITPAIVGEFESKMNDAGKSIVVKEYDAEHAFANPSNPMYNKAFAESAHKESISFIKKQLKEF